VTPPGFVTHPIRLLGSIGSIAFRSLFLGGASVGPFPDPAPLWKLQADGALVAFAFGFIPIFLPLLPVFAVYDSVRRDRSSGHLEGLMTRSLPRWAAGVGSFVGLSLALAVWVLFVDALSLGLIMATSFSAVSGGLAWAFVLSTLLLTALYLALALWLSTFLSPPRARAFSLLLWLLFNVAQPIGFTVVGQFFAILQVRASHSFATSLSDLGTFTGLHDGFLALSVPDALQFVVRAGRFDLSGGLEYAAVPMVGPLALLFLLLLYLYFLSRAPLGR